MEPRSGWTAVDDTSRVHQMESAVEIRQLRAFVALVEHGSVTAAAQVLGLAQSTMSETLSSLERAVGSAILLRRRGAHEIARTSAGEALLPYAREARRARRPARAGDPARVHPHGRGSRGAARSPARRPRAAAHGASGARLQGADAASGDARARRRPAGEVSGGRWFRVARGRREGALERTSATDVGPSRTTYSRLPCRRSWGGSGSGGWWGAECSIGYIARDRVRCTLSDT